MNIINDLWIQTFSNTNFNHTFIITINLLSICFVEPTTLLLWMINISKESYCINKCVKLSSTTCWKTVACLPVFKHYSPNPQAIIIIIIE